MIGFNPYEYNKSTKRTKEMFDDIDEKDSLWDNIIKEKNRMLIRSIMTRKQ